MLAAPRSLLAAVFCGNARKDSFNTFCTAAADGLHFVADYLVSRCNLSPSAAKKAAKRLSGVKSTAKPDATLAFLRDLGVGEPHFKRIFSWRPHLLAADVDKTLRPKVDGLRGMGFSSADIADIIVANPSVLAHYSTQANIAFLQSLFSDTPTLFKVLRRDPTLLYRSFGETLVSNFAILEKRGVSLRDITFILHARPRLLTRPPAQFLELVKRVEHLGFEPHTSVYLRAIGALFGSKSVLRDKMEAMMDFGWTEADFYAAFLKSPVFLDNSAEALRAKMKFLVEDAGLTPAYIVDRPRLLTCSLERRLVPRFRAIEALKASGHIRRTSALFSLFLQSEKSFLETLIVPNMDAVPELRQIYPLLLASSPSGVRNSSPPPSIARSAV